MSHKQPIAQRAGDGEQGTPGGTHLCWIEKVFKHAHDADALVASTLGVDEHHQLHTHTEQVMCRI